MFYRSLDEVGFDQAMHGLNTLLHVDAECPLVVTLGNNGEIRIDFLTMRLPHNEFRFLLGY